ncbi:MAG: ATPase [Prevotellaceae bacterium]|nr:ATPase [Prevotellaceae bacterium]
MILIADSGSTKTAWCMVNSKTTEQHAICTQGINPFHQNEEDICAILRHELYPHIAENTVDIEHIFFYGAGCTKEKSQIVANALRNAISPTAKINVESDMLGAARAVCGHQKGIVCILGTGSNSCYYDGRDLHSGIPALGYILGDEGSGAYIGRRLVSDILKCQLDEDIRIKFFEETKETEATIIQKVYRSPFPNRYLASLSLFCHRHRTHPSIHSLLLDCFSQFFVRNILPAPWSHSPALHTVHFVGSIAYYYQAELTEAALTCGIKLGTIVQSPIKGLIQYHQT